MELIRNYLFILIIAVFTQIIDGGIFKSVALNQEPSQLEDVVDEKEAPLTKRQSSPFYFANPFFSYSTFSPQNQNYPQPSNTQFVNYQKPIKVPVQEYYKVPPQQPNYENNPFLSGSGVVPVPAVTSTPNVPTTPSYVNNPFLNSQQVASNVNQVVPSTPVTVKPVVETSSPSFGNNPFINVHGEFVQTSPPVQVTTTTTARPPQVNPNNPFFKPSVIIVPPLSNAPVDTSRAPVQPVQPVHPVYPVQPIQPVQPVHPVYPVQPVQPVQPEQHSQLRSFCAKARGQFPSGRCNTFVNCWDSVAVEQTCPPGLVFNYAGYCDYPQNVDCHGRSVEEVFVPQAPQTVSFVTTGQTDTTNVPSQPTVPVVIPETNFVPSSTILPPFPDVTNTVPPVVYVPPPVDQRLKAMCLKPRGQFPSDLCNRYIDCWDDSVKEFECPEGLYFSEKGYCDYLYNVNCQNRTLHKADVSQSSACPHPDGGFRDKNNCSRYFVCINNVVAGQHECPEGLYYNEMVGVCDYKHNVNCFREPFIYQPTQTQTNLNETPAGVLGVTKNCEPGKVFRLASDCSSAVLCRKGVTEVVYCPSGLAYDAQSDRCLPQQLAKCQDF